MRKIIFVIFAVLFIGVLGTQTERNNLDLNNQSPPFIQTQDPQPVENPLNPVPEIVERSLPSVVTIAVETPQRRGINARQNIGSGFIVSDNGLIVTNKHVVSLDEVKYSVLIGDEPVGVKAILRDPLNDLALLKVNLTNTNPLPLGDSSAIQLGETAIAIGTPLGEFTNTVTEGIISGIGRGIVTGSPYQQFVERLDNVIQTDAAINPGNSGGPLLNVQGQVVGVNTAVALGGQNLGFAIPVNEVKTLLETFIARGGTFTRPYLGVRYQLLTPQEARRVGLIPGAYVVEVIDGSPADQAGLRQGDIIQSLAGQEVQSEDAMASLGNIIFNQEIGETVPITFWRDGRQFSTTVTLTTAE